MRPIPLTEESMSVIWAQINKLHPNNITCCFFGMEVEDWQGFGVNGDDLPQEAYEKISNGIEQKLVNKIYGWYECPKCETMECEHCVGSPANIKAQGESNVTKAMELLS